MKVLPFQIPKLLNHNLIVQIDRSTTFYDNLHQHNEIQISLIVSGTGKLLVGDSIHPFKDGDFFVIGANCPHLFKNQKTNIEVHMISIFFTEETFGENFFNLSDLEEVRPFFKNAKDGFLLQSKNNTVTKLMHQFNEASKMCRIILFLKLLAVLSNADKKSLTNFTYPKELSLLAGERMQVVFDYVLEHFHEEIKLNTISSLVFMTPNAFCRFFKQSTNKTFFQFLIELRLEHACQLLNTNKGLSIAEIAEQSGFTSISNFNRKFKTLKGVIPSHYMHIEM